MIKLICRPVNAHVGCLILTIFHVHIRLLHVDTETSRAILCALNTMKNSLISSYSKSIYSIRNNTDWVIPKYICYRVVLPPKSQQLLGIPKNERI